MSTTIATRTTICEDALTQALDQIASLSAVSFVDPPAAPKCTVLAILAFAGPFSGVVELLAPWAFAELLARNLRPHAHGNRPHRAPDALKELLNLTCSTLFARLSAESADPFEIAVPGIVTAQQSTDWDLFVSHPGTVVLDADGIPVALRLITCSEVA
jgi:hypothetical protein